MNLAPPATFGLTGWAEKAALVGIVLAATVAFFALIRVLTPHLVRRASQITDPQKWQQRRTAVTLLATMLRYTALVAAVGAIVAILAGAGGVGALGGSAVIAVTIGFASQRLLTDVIAGFFVLFEGQYAVGDTIAVEPSKIVGVVEELGVRTTLIREPDGSHTYIPNGQITAVRRFSSPQTSLVVTIFTRNGDSGEAALRDLSRLAGPTHGVLGAIGTIERHDAGGGVTMLRTTIGASAMMATTAHGIVLSALRTRLENDLAQDPVIVPVERTRNLTGPVTEA